MHFITRIILMMVPEKYLLKHGLWDEHSGDPVNLEAEEFDRRDALAAAPQKKEG